MFGFLAITFGIRTIMRSGFLATGSIGVEGGIGLKATGGVNAPIGRGSLQKLATRVRERNGSGGAFRGTVIPRANNQKKRLPVRTVGFLPGGGAIIFSAVSATPACQSQAGRIRRSS
jgi:hypothetical protein